MKPTSFEGKVSDINLIGLTSSEERIVTSRFQRDVKVGQLEADKISKLVFSLSIDAPHGPEQVSISCAAIKDRETIRGEINQDNIVGQTIRYVRTVEDSQEIQSYTYFVTERLEVLSGTLRGREYNSKHYI